MLSIRDLEREIAQNRRDAMQSKPPHVPPAQSTVMPSLDQWIVAASRVVMGGALVLAAPVADIVSPTLRDVIALMGKFGLVLAAYGLIGHVEGVVQSHVVTTTRQMLTVISALQFWRARPPVHPGHSSRVRQPNLGTSQPLAADLQPHPRTGSPAQSTARA